ncbi:MULTISPECIES: hypothetical protein [unclassified Paenibacillus]|uniref:DUF7408 domain-containing protein n=1 Tax=unclassified Paenibacillus TaxID=185978 RepID=UPI001AE7A5E3|nr:MULTISPECIES: hypothetical protein [unclassified Paenibacillus]MBP1153794.1 hypothetical protein [Paenibacillus sp. PvP091]MBP1170821.1 hypothetical protein [Paenibacillus sp. PvR098]MBP2441849.1 hypothetical protein [Paenibacillus sp. PvP052]
MEGFQIERTRVVRWLLPLLLALCVAIQALAGTVGAAPVSSGVELQIQAGIDGKTKEGRWFPVKFTLTSPSEDISGDLVVQMVNPSGGKDITYVKHIELPKQSTKSVWMSLPGMALNNRNNVVKLYQGSSDGGTLVPIAKGNDYIETTVMRSTQVGVLARDPDTLNFLSLLNTQGYDVSVSHLDIADLPTETMMLDSLDVIAMNDVASDQLGPEQVQAIHGWVARGGSLILAGGAGYSKTAKAFESLSPVTYQGTASLSQLTSFESLAAKELKLTEPFTVSSAAVKSGDVLAQEGQVPLLVQREVEKGRVWYVGYDLALQPLASWTGNAVLWEQVLQPQLVASNPKNGGQNHMMNRYWDLQYILDFFPSMNPPSFFLLLTLFLVYVLLAAPLLYILLKKMDKREWAWVVIPVLSIVSSLGIFAAGASDKSSIMTHTLNTLELSGSGQGTRSAATAVFVPSGGTYELQLPKSAQVVSFNDRRGSMNQNGQLAGTTDQYLFMEPEATRLAWTDVPYWSVRKALIEHAESEPLGKFEVVASINNNGIKGEVTNQTKSDLTNVNVFYNRQLFAIGDLKAGEKRAISGSVNTMPQGYVDYGQIMFPFTHHARQDEFNRERQMVNSYMNRLGNAGKGGEAMVIGWSKDEESLYQVNGKKTQSDQLNMWVQEVEFQVVQGDQISIPYGYLNPSMVQNNLQQMHTEPDGNMYVSSGDFTFEYKLPVIQGAEYDTLRIQSVGALPPFLSLQIWNETKKDWDPLDLRAVFVLQDGRQNDVLIGGRTIRLKATVMQDLGFRYPQVALEGKVKR